MSAPVGTLLILLCLLQIKHMFADYFLQTARMLSGRGEYWHIGRAQHAGVHAAGSAIALALTGATAGFIATAVALEWLVHFHIDFWKARQCDRKALGPAKAGFWRVSGIDQALHQLTYVAMAWAWTIYAA